MALRLIDAEDRDEVLDRDLPDVKDGDAETVYIIRSIGLDDYRAIVKARSTTRPNPRTQIKETILTAEAEALVNEDILDFVLVDWRGVLFRGAPAPCTREHKLRLDPVRQLAIRTLGGMNKIARVQEARAESFREPA